VADYDFTDCLSALDFELLSKDLLEAELGIQLENFSEGRDKGIDLRYAPIRSGGRTMFNLANIGAKRKPSELIVQCKRYSKFSDLKSTLKNEELAKLTKLKPDRYILTTAVSLSPQQTEDLKAILSPFVQATGDIYGRERLNSLLTKHPEVERRHIKLWVSSAGVLNSIVNARTHVISSEEVERTIASAKIYVRNPSFDEALAILKKHRVCIISGLPGIGKTTLARMLLLYHYERNFNVVKIESDISEARAVGYHNKPRFYYYDDFLGQTAQADKLNKNEDQKLMDFMARVRDSKDSVFVLTTREYILTQAKLHYEKLAREKFDHRTCIIDLAKYSRRIRAQILYNHLHFSKLPRTHLKRLVAKRGYVEIVDHENYNPRIIEYLVDRTWIGETPSAQYLDLFLKNLDNPVEIWGHAFHSQLSDRDRHLLFVLTTMPVESLLRDVEQAFVALHNAQCARFNIAHSATDFRSALKVLDGTFVATRKLQDFTLVRFQNPSIRDFMQNLLLSGELLPEVINALVFFEQAKRFEATLRDDKPQVSLKELARHASKIVGAMQQLVAAPSCSISIHGYQESQRVSPAVLNPAERLATIARALANEGGRSGDAWMTTKICELATNLTAGKLSASSCVEPIKALENLSCLASAAGKELMSAFKHRAMNKPGDLDDFETLANVVDALPKLFTKSELQTIREAYTSFADEYRTSCDLTNPDELREEASRVGNVGDVLKVDTDSAQESLRETADEIERQEPERPDDDEDDDDDRRGGGDSEICSDAELDSMFGTLGS
jgi:hypothetical protein